MRFRLAIFLVLASTILLCLGASEDECPAAEYSDNLVNYFNQIAKAVKTRFDRIKVEKENFLKELNNNLAETFENASCPQLWKKDLELPVPWLYSMMKAKEPAPPKVAIDFIEQAEKSFWLGTEDHVLSTCFTSVTRGFEISFLRECAGEGVMPVDVTELKDVGIPDFYKDKKYLDNVRGAVNMIAWGVVQANECGIGADKILATLNSVVKAADEELCYSGSDSFVSDACYKRFRDSCPKILHCFDDLAKHMNTHSTKLFIKEVHRYKKCFVRSTDYWKEVGRPKDMDTPAILMARGLKHWNAMAKMEFSDEELEASYKYMGAFLLTKMHATTCNCELPTPPGGSDDEK